MATLRRPIETIDEGFRMLRRRWFPAPTGLQAGFLQSVGDWMRTNVDLRDRADLHPLTWQLYREAAAPSIDPSSAEGITAIGKFVRELRTVAEWLGMMETAFYGADLDSHHSHPLNRGWNSAFRRWADDPTFRLYWPILRGEFSRRMVEFCEQELNLGVEIRLEPCSSADDRNRSAAVLGRLGAAYEREFRTPADAEGRTNVRYPTLNDVWERVGEMAWIVHWTPLDAADAGKLTTACGLIAVLSPSSSDGAHELFVWIDGRQRNLQVGRQAFGAKIGKHGLFDLADPRNGYVIDRLVQESGPAFRDLRVYLPRTHKEESRSRDLRSMWYAFFTPYGFRKMSDPLDEHSDPGFEVLRYDAGRLQ